MGMCISGYTLQAKVDEILGDIKGVNTYIENIIVLIKDNFTKNI